MAEASARVHRVVASIFELQLLRLPHHFDAVGNVNCVRLHAPEAKKRRSCYEPRQCAEHQRRDRSGSV